MYTSKHTKQREVFYKKELLLDFTFILIFYSVVKLNLLSC